jgi:hypothetical protein
MGAQIPTLVEKTFVSCGCKKFKVDTLGDHLSTCTAHSGVKKSHDWVVGQLTDLLSQHIQQKLNRWLESGDMIVGTWSSWDI